MNHVELRHPSPHGRLRSLYLALASIGTVVVEYKRWWRERESRLPTQSQRQADQFDGLPYLAIPPGPNPGGREREYHVQDRRSEPHQHA